MPNAARRPPDGKFPDAVIASVKNNTSFLSLLKTYGIAYRKAGGGYKAVCPFHTIDGHPEREPSFSVDMKSNLGHCFGCGKGVNVIQFVMEMDKVTFPEAVEKLLAVKGSGGKTAEAAKGKTVDAATVPTIFEEQRQTILREIVRTTTDALRNSRPGREYLEGRGLDPLQLLDAYTFGYWNGTLFDKLAGGEKKKLSALGLYNGSPHALFENCIVFPLEKEGRIATIYGRKAAAQTGNTPEGRHYLLPCKREGLFLPRCGLNAQRPVIITESIIDGLSLFAAGVTNVLPLLGVNGFLPDHLEYLKMQHFPLIHIALNGDEAGNKAAAQLRQNLAARQLPATIITLPDSKDINDLLREMGPGKLREWFDERTGGKGTSGDKPTVWEDEAGDTFITVEDREYRIRGLSPFGMDRLKVNVKANRIGKRDTFHVDTLDLYQAKGRDVFVNQTARILDAEPAEIARDVSALITVLEELRLRKKNEESGSRKHYVMSDGEKREALDYLRSPDLLDRIAADFASCGMVGNRNQNLLAYLGGLSRLTDHPFGTLIVSRSGAGKSFLQDMVASFTPEESLLRMTRLTGQSLFYQGKDGLKHKLLTIEEDEGMQEAMYSIRTLLSSQKLTLHGLKTDPKSGEFRAFENTVHGPASVMISTTNLAAFDHESVNRFFVLFLDESREQTAAILEQQRRMAGIAKINLTITRDRIRKLHGNIQRLLKPVMVVNRMGTGIDYPAEILNTRREQTKTEALIETVALLHQYQRQIHSETVCGIDMQYIEVTKEDIVAVHAIAGDVLRQSLDEMPKLCRDLLGVIHELIDEKFKAAVTAGEEKCPQRWRITVTRKEVKDRSGWSNWHVREHIEELVESGYITPRIGKQGQKYAYSLVEDHIPEQHSLTTA